MLMAAALMPCFVHGGTISLQVQASSTIRNGKPVVQLVVRNLGEEPAHRVDCILGLQQHAITTQVARTLAPGESRSRTVSFPSPPHPPGRHTVLINTQYRDSQQHAFSARSYLPLVSSDPDGLHEIKMNVGALELVDRTNGRFPVTLHNPTDTPLTVTMTLHLPDEFTCDTPRIHTRLPALQSKRFQFDVHNQHALPGSAYAALFVAEFTQDGIHQSQVTAGPIAIKTRSTTDWRRYIWGLAGLLFAAFFILQFSHILPAPIRIRIQQFHTRKQWENLVEGIVLAGIFFLLLSHLSPRELLLNTTTVGGDTPAHNYLASHLKDTLFSQGRILHWAPGWWCGFPMFQFYFPLPYLLMVFLNLLLPFNLAFKLVSVLGVLSLPFSAWLSAHWMRIPRPAPVLAAALTAPLLFDPAHTMWGVNLYSTLAGMIANSISFSLMLLFLGAIVRDGTEGRFRIRTVLLYCALLSSHFFTSLMASMAVLIVPLLRPPCGIRRSLQTMAGEAICGLLIMGWWWLPLLLKHSLAVEFGSNWDIHIFSAMSPFFRWLLPFALLSLLPATRSWRIPIAVYWNLLLLAIFFFLFGYRHVSPTFVNIRLWPFLIWAPAMLAAAGAPALLPQRPASGFATLAALLLILSFGITDSETIRHWSRWNYEGLENKQEWPALQHLLEQLDGTSGRLAYDLHHDNNRVGSTRIFELVPHLIDKPVLEGGIVNSAQGALFAYYVQCETSRNCAGFPTAMTPTSFNITNATRHLELLNVKHFIARDETTKDALQQHPAWQRLDRAGPWELYELMSHQGDYIVLPTHHPPALLTESWIQEALTWFYDPDMTAHPVVWLAPENEINADEFHTVLDRRNTYNWRDRIKHDTTNKIPIPREAYTITPEEISAGRIAFRTDAIGLPHILKINWFPNWQVEGAARIYRVSPGFMLVFPDREQVIFSYGFTRGDRIAHAITMAGWLLLFLITINASRKKT